MSKKRLIGFLLYMCCFQSLTAFTIDNPTQFFVKQRWFSLTNTFDIETSTGKLGIIQRKLLSLTPQYRFYDLNNELQAKAVMRFFKIGATFDVWDANDLILGHVNEKILTFFTTFDMHLANEGHIATAKLNFWGTKYTIKDPKTEEVIALLWRNFFRFKDNWTVDIINPGLFAEKQIDPRFFVLVMAFQSDRDYWSQYIGSQSQSPRFNHIVQNNSHELDLSFSKLEQYREKLENYRQSLSVIELEDDNLESLDIVVERHLNSYECEYAHSDAVNVPIEIARIQAKERGLGVLMPLFDSEELSPGQKSALFHLIDRELP